MFSRHAVIALAGAVIVLTAAVSTPAVAGSVRGIGGTNPNDCTVAEYRAVHKGMSKTRVMRIMDGKRAVSGKSLEGNKTTLSYGWVLKGSICQVGFKDGNVYTKARF